jgi:hypothetical protein
MASESSGDIISDELFQSLLSEIIIRDRVLLEEIGCL